MCKTRCGSVKFWALQNIVTCTKNCISWTKRQTAFKLWITERFCWSLLWWTKRCQRNHYEHLSECHKQLWLDSKCHYDRTVLDPLLSDTVAEFDRIFDIILEDLKKAILGLTTALNEKDANIQPSMLLRHPLGNIWEEMLWLMVVLLIL